MNTEPLKTENGMQIGPVEFIWARNSKEFFFSNSILIHDSHATIVDPSANFSYLEHLASQKSVQYVLNTHYHVDHRSLNSLFKYATFMCHPLDLKPLVNFENYLQYADQETDSEYIQWLKGIFSNLDIQTGYFSIQLQDQDLLPLQDQKVQVVHLPGHTPGHIGLFFADIDLLYISDVDLTPLGPWYANISSDIDQFLNSFKKIREFQCRFYATSHGSRIYEPEKFLEKLDRFEEAFAKRDEALQTSLQEGPKTLSELSKVGIIYKKTHLESDPLKASFERQMLQKHLERLARLSQVTKQDDDRWYLTS